MASLFTSETPTGTNNDDGAPGITFGVSLMFAVAGEVSAVRFYATSTVSGTYTAGAWAVTADDDPGPGAGTLLDSKVLSGSPTVSTWNDIVFDTPVTVAADTLYRFAVHSSAGRYVNTASVFTSDVVNGDITGPANGSDPDGLGTLRQAVFAINAALTYPATTGNGTNYFADVVFTPDGVASPAPTGIAVAVALGAPTVDLGLAPAPAGLAVTAGLGEPAVALGLAPAPSGVAVAVALGEPTIGETTLPAVTPDGIAVTVGLGHPTGAPVGWLAVVR